MFIIFERAAISHYTIGQQSHVFCLCKEYLNERIYVILSLKSKFDTAGGCQTNQRESEIMTFFHLGNSLRQYLQFDPPLLSLTSVPTAEQKLMDFRNM